MREVLVLGRRGPESAAYTRPELLALTRRAGVELVVDDSDPRTGRVIDSALPGQHAALLQGVRREAVDWSAPVGAGPKRLILRFHSTPVAIIGDHRVRGVRVAGRDGEVEIPAGLVIRAVGQPAARAAVRPGDRHHPERARWVVGMPGTYVAGWIKRGSSDGIGANRTCAAETVGALLDDALAGRLPARSSRAGSLPLLRRLAGPERPERRSQTWHFQA